MMRQVSIENLLLFALSLNSYNIPKHLKSHGNCVGIIECFEKLQYLEFILNASAFDPHSLTDSKSSENNVPSSELKLSVVATTMLEYI